MPKGPGPFPLKVPLPVWVVMVGTIGALSPVGFPSAVVEPFAVFRVSRVVVVAGRAGVTVDVVTQVAGGVRAGRVGHLAVLVLFIPVVVRWRSGERSG